MAKAYHPILFTLTDPKKKRGLQFIVNWLERRKLLDTTYYGCGQRALPFKEVKDLLEATNG